MVNLPPLMEPEEGKREEIEQAASESRHLADELAGMLDQLEIEEERSAAVNAAVLGEQEEVEEALKVGNISILYHSKSCQAFSFNLIIHS